ncbi:MAG: YHS domain-containing protein [Chitinispirillaceae bacterium]|jgi:YHS domain-containing protein
MNFSRKVVIAFAVAMFSAAIAFAQSGQPDTGKATTANAGVAGVEKTKQLKPQTTCPVMGGAIDKNLYVDYKGKRIYVCCEGCLAKLRKNPEKYLKKLEKMGQAAEKIETGGAPDTAGKAADTKGTGMKK